MNNPNLYTEEYFKTLNYSDYLTRKPKYLKTAEELSDLLKKLSIINKESYILDYGCATGFLMEGFIELGYTNVSGYDISEWAVQQAKSKGLNIIDGNFGNVYDLFIALDVFEHMTDDAIYKALRTFQSDKLLVRIPCAIQNSNEFYLDVSKRDKTHINCKDPFQWEVFFRDMGYYNIFLLNLLTIYNSSGVLCALFLKSY